MHLVQDRDRLANLLQHFLPLHNPLPPSAFGLRLSIDSVGAFKLARHPLADTTHSGTVLSGSVIKSHKEEDSREVRAGPAAHIFVKHFRPLHGPFHLQRCGFN